MALSKQEKLAIYERNLAAYEAEGDEEKAAVERRLIDRIKRGE